MSEMVRFFAFVISAVVLVPALGFIWQGLKT